MNNKILEYYKIIYKVMNDLHCSLDEEMQDEMFYEGLIGLYNGIKTFNKERNTKESTYYYVCIKNAILRKYHFNTRPRRDRINTISLDETIYGQSELKDTIASDIDIEQEIIKQEQWDVLVNTLNHLKDTKWKTYICEFYGIGLPQLTIKEMSKKYGISAHAIQSSILQGIKRLKKKVKKEYENKKNN